MAIKKQIQAPSETRNVIGAVILVKFENGSIHQAIMPKEFLLGIISSHCAYNGTLQVNDKPIERITF